MGFAAYRLRVAGGLNLTIRLQFVALSGSFLLLVCLSGCGKSSDKVSVHGHVSYQGAPLESAALTFFPAKGRSESATVTNGEYSVALLPGEYTAAVLIGVNLPKGYKEGDPIPPPKFVLPEIYTSQAKSPLKATVAAGKNEPIDFELK
jgi:hypothetical protein